jgi:hypothetical protein
MLRTAPIGASPEHLLYKAAISCPGSAATVQDSEGTGKEVEPG